MAEKGKMTPEVMEKLKKATTKEEAEEILGVRLGGDVQMLTVDELDAFSGGESQWEFGNEFTHESIDAYAAILEQIINNISMDVAIQFANDCICPTKDNADWLRAGGPWYWAAEWHRRRDWFDAGHTYSY